MRAWLRVLWVALGLVVVFLASFAAASRLSGQADNRTVGRADGDVVDRVDVDVDSAAVRVVGDDVDRVHVQLRLTWSFRKPKVEQRVRNGTLYLRVRCPRVPIGKGCGGSVELRVPRDTQVVAHSGAGGVTVSGVEGNVGASSSAGDVEVRDLSGQLTLTSGAGDIIGTALRALHVSATTSAGEVDLAFVAAPGTVEARSSAGDVSVRVPRGEASYRVDAGTTAGDADVGVPSDQGSTRTINVRSSAGDVRVVYAG